MSDLVAFLNARLADEERSPTPGRAELDDLRFELKHGDPWEQHLSSRIEDGLDGQTMVWEARVLREVAAKRAILRACDDDPDMHGPDWNILHDDVLDALAAVYADHPEFDPAWKPA